MTIRTVETPQQVFEDLLSYAVAANALGTHPPLDEWRSRFSATLETFWNKPSTYEQALDNLTAENWHTERRLIEERVAHLEAQIPTR